MDSHRFRTQKELFIHFCKLATLYLNRKDILRNKTNHGIILFWYYIGVIILLTLHIRRWREKQQSKYVHSKYCAYHNTRNKYNNNSEPIFTILRTIILIILYIISKYGILSSGSSNKMPVHPTSNILDEAGR